MKRLSILFILILGSVFWVLPSATQAESCSCFCSSTAGAIDQGDVADVASCQDLCDDYLGCYTEEQENLEPRFNTLCWEKYECEESETGDSMGTWAGQHPSCIPEEGYCYSAPIPVSLNIAIGSLTEAESLGEYINAGYSYVLGAGSLLAIVFIMLGGVQYMLARGKPEAIGKAKSRIKGAVTGIILLFASYAIANLVDPNFTTFNRVAPPKIRTIVFLDADSTCDAMGDAGITITPSTGSCGEAGIVSDLGDTATTIEIGDDCVYSKCYDDVGNIDILSTCVGSASAESGYECLRCFQVADRGVLVTTSDLPPSDFQCSKLVPIDLYPDDDTSYYCEYNEDGASECVEVSYPEQSAGVNCELLRQDAKSAGSEGCRAYDLLMIGDYDVELIDFDGMQNLDYTEIDNYRNDSYEYEILEKFCSSSDVCGLAPPGENCEVSVVEYADIPTVFLPSISLGVDDVMVNCANESSDNGLTGCLDKNGDEADCQWGW